MESYLLQSNIALVVFYLLYRAVVIRENNQQLKRLMGLGVALFCSCFPFLPSFRFESSAGFPSVFQEAIESTASFQSALDNTPQASVSPWFLVYLAGVGIFSIRFLFGIYGIIRLYINSEVSKRWGFVLVETMDSVSPFSFFNYLFIRKGEVENPNLGPIILHEQYHRDQLHSVDAIILEILTILFWFNPCMWLLQKDIKASHEYLADDYVISIKGFDKLAYQDLLFAARTGISYKSANYLSNQTSLKQRFNMMEKRKFNSKTSFLRVGTVLAAMAFAVFITSFSTVQDVFKDDIPDIQIFTKDGRVDLEKGIPKTTNKLFIRMVPKEDDPMRAYRVSQVTITLVVDGLGRESQKTGESIDLSNTLSTIQSTDKECTLLVEVNEYQTMDEQKRVEKVTPEKLILFKIPIE